MREMVEGGGGGEREATARSTQAGEPKIGERMDKRAACPLDGAKRAAGGILALYARERKLEKMRKINNDD